MVKKHLIYGLVDPHTSELRYIGRSSNGLSRPRSHWRPRIPQGNSHCYNWLRVVLSSGEEPLIRVIQEFEPSANVNENLNEAEIYWISFFRNKGCPLTNMTPGGDAIPDTNGEKNGMYGKKHSVYSIEKMRQAKLGKRLDDGAYKRGAEKRRGLKQSEETIKKKVEAISKPVMCLNDGKTFSSMVEAGKYYGTTHVNDVVYGRRKHTKGLKFVRIEKK